MGFFEWPHKLFVPSSRNAYRPHLLRRRTLLFLLGVVLVSEGALISTLIARDSGQGFLAAVVQSEIFSLTNVQRVQNSAPELVENTLLDKSAQAKADDMAAKGYFAHKSPDGTEPWAWISAAGYDYQYAGENLAVRFVDSKDVVAAWMASPSHRANITKSVYRDIGVGIAQGMYKGQPATFVVQHFGKQMDKAALSVVPPAPVVPGAYATGSVLGVQTTSGSSAENSIVRQLGRLLSEPRATSAWVLGAVAVLLLLALAFAFVHHVQIQASDLLLPGTVVAGIALSLLALNAGYLSPTVEQAQSQPAGAALYAGGLEIGDAAAIER